MAQNRCELLINFIYTILLHIYNEIKSKFFTETLSCNGIKNTLVNSINVVKCSANYMYFQRLGAAPPDPYI